MQRRQIIYRSAHRGCKETDFLLGDFFAAKLVDFADAQLPLICNFLQEDDMKIYDWILNKEITPEDYLVLVEDIRKFHKIF